MIAVGGMCVLQGLGVGGGGADGGGSGGLCKASRGADSLCRKTVSKRRGIRRKIMIVIIGLRGEEGECKDNNNNNNNNVRYRRRRDENLEKE